MSVAPVAVVSSLRPSATACYLVDALREAGHEALVISDAPDARAQVLRRGVVDVASVLAEQGVSPGFLLFVEGGSMTIFPGGMERLSCPTAWWAIDTHMDYGKHLRVARLFDVTFVAQREYVERLRGDGIRHVHWLPLAFAPALHPAPAPERSIDVAYVGSDLARIHPERHRLLGILRERFPSHHLGRASPEEMGRIYASARVVFNRSVNNDVNMRFFEAAGAGAVLVTDRIAGNGVDEVLQEGRHYLAYDDEESMVRAVESLLVDPERRDEMGRAARAHVLAHHTYLHRARALAQAMSSETRHAAPDPTDAFAVLLALGLVGDALDEAARALRAAGGGPFARRMAVLAAAGVQAVGHGVKLAEALRAQMRR